MPPGNPASIDETDEPPSEFAIQPADDVERELPVLHTGHGVVNQRTHFTNDDDSAAAEDERDTLTAAGR